MEEVTIERLAHMFQVAGVTPSEADLHVLLPLFHQYSKYVEGLRSAGLETEELGGVFSPHWQGE